MYVGTHAKDMEAARRAFPDPARTVRVEKPPEPGVGVW